MTPSYKRVLAAALAGQLLQDEAGGSPHPNNQGYSKNDASHPNPVQIFGDRPSGGGGGTLTTALRGIRVYSTGGGAREGPYLRWGQAAGVGNVIYRKVVIRVAVEVVATLGHS